MRNKVQDFIEELNDTRFRAFINGLKQTFQELPILNHYEEGSQKREITFVLEEHRVLELEFDLESGQCEATFMEDHPLLKYHTDISHDRRVDIAISLCTLYGARIFLGNLKG